MAKHGIDFIRAQRLWLDKKRVETTARSMEGECRLRLIARIDQSLWAAIFTKRKQAVRLISVRRARKNEKELYNEIT
ncbi:BrnT family toxin [Puniceicoccales bacterium CK1056]|uniref:BrnT family toxin n=1 Tax=Oceanipulchritudo coccoides TaxID=2706888 RepID=A0A6B2M5R4_9BACT|nr:BrnT family toxin [Oceanipulchritudo coccoides]NDV63020.1 BrnT family toxin [Oceanipulchritudo coccoides]